MGKTENKEMLYGLSDSNEVLMLQKTRSFSYATK